MARDSTESRFREVLERFGGPQNVQLVGELRERAESRTLLESFLREVFPDTAGALRSETGGHGEEPSGCKPRAPQLDSDTHRPRKPDRTLRFGLVFFVCRPESLLQRRARRQLREILRDVRERMAAGGAVIGVILQPGDNNGQPEIPEDRPEGGPDQVASLLALLHSAFPPEKRSRLCAEVRAALLVPGREESRRDVQNLACEAITAADELRKQRPEVKPWCFLWRKKRRQEDVLKEHPEEGTALTVLQYPNGDCSETVTDA